MLFRYLSLKNKYFLNGFDWVMGVIDAIMRHATCSGNASQVVYMLDSPPDEALFRAGLQEFLTLFPVIGGSVSRHYPTLAPYWKMPTGQGGPPVPLTIDRLPEVSNQSLLVERLAAFVNAPFCNEREHLAFHLVYGQGVQCLAMTFDHRLFDARGAEAFINLFLEYLAANRDPKAAEGVRLVQGIDLSQWQQKFLAGQAVNRKMVALSQDTIRALPVAEEKQPGGFSYRIISFDNAETERITGTAFDNAGYLMIMPYLFARVFQALHEVFETRGAPPGVYVVPVSTDLRQAKSIKTELFFNHNSMFFFRVKPEDVPDLKQLICSIKEQMYEQVQSKFPQNLMEASSLTRIMPLSLLRRIFHLPLQGKIASFCFSHVSKCSYTSDELMGVRIVNVFHMPRLPVPPGIGIFFNTFGGRLNATISWLDGTFTAAEIDSIDRDLRSSL